jgi:hypothetical protein
MRNMRKSSRVSHQAKERPDPAPEAKPERAHHPVCAGAFGILIGDFKPLAGLCGGFQRVDPRARVGIRGAEGNRMHRHLCCPVARLFGQHRVDLYQRFLGGSGHRRPAPGADQPCAHGQRHDLVPGEHQGRKIEPRPHHVSDTRLALDGHASAHEIRDVAVDRAFRHFQALGQLPGGDEPTTSQILHDLEEAVGPAHLSPSSSRKAPASCRRGRWHRPSGRTASPRSGRRWRRPRQCSARARPRRCP